MLYDLIVFLFCLQMGLQGYAEKFDILFGASWEKAGIIQVEPFIFFRRQTT